MWRIVTLTSRMAHTEAMLDKRAQHEAEMARIKGGFELKKMEIEADMMANRILKDWLLKVFPLALQLLLAILLILVTFLFLVLLAPSKGDIDICDVLKLLTWSVITVLIWESF